MEELPDNNLAKEDEGFIDKLNFPDDVIEQAANSLRSRQYPKEKMPLRNDYPLKEEGKDKK